VGDPTNTQLLILNNFTIDLDNLYQDQFKFKLTYQITYVNDS